MSEGDLRRTVGGDGCVLERAVLVHAGARDAYQLALALAEAGLLERLVTDLYWSGRQMWLEAVLGGAAPGLLTALQKRQRPGLPGARVRTAWVRGVVNLLLEKSSRVPFRWRQGSTRAMDAALGRTAGGLARRTGAGMVSYSYTGYDAIRAYGRPAMLFQVHPHPGTVRELLREELAAHPDCAASLTQEWELALPEEDYRHLVEESAMAARYLAASSFTRESLVEHGVRREAVTVVPYGVDLEHFHPDAASKGAVSGPLRLLFVGRINQRKGIKYLLEALRLLRSDELQLTICGRVVDDLALFRPFGSSIEIRPSVTAEELVKAYQAADLFVFPSVAEGFGQVLLESLASGLPILSTTHTAAPDLIEEGREGFIVEPRQPEMLAERIEWALSHRGALREMGRAARERAESFTWARFRIGAAGAVREYLEDPEGARIGAAQPPSRR